jgi:hypothetical protein
MYLNRSQMILRPTSPWRLASYAWGSLGLLIFKWVLGVLDQWVNQGFNT